MAPQPSGEADEPRILWHYTTQAGALGIFADRAIRASDIRFLNDSKEYDWAVTMLRSILGEYRQGTRELEPELAARIDSALDGNVPYSFQHMADVGFFAACFSEEPDDLGQWRGYAEGGGYALGFPREAIERVATRHEFSLVRCMYSEDEAQEALRGAFDSAFGGMRPELEDHWHRAVNRAAAEFMHTFGALAPRMKHPAFAAEKEWRLVRGPVVYFEQRTIVETEDQFDARRRERRISLRPGRGTLTPFVSVPLSNDAANAPDGTADFPVVEVRIGPTPHPELAKLAITRAALNAGATLEILRVEHTSIPYRAW